jgi:predicted nucleotide-binding protein (sugar kinase/HSP70/actin superfamily)
VAIVRHLAIPNLGNYSIALAAAVESLGIEAWATTCTTPESMRLGIAASPDSTCVPFKAHIGHFLEAANAGVKYALMVNSIGTCRLRYYRALEQKILAERGVEMRVFGLGYDGFKPPVVRYFDPKLGPFLMSVANAVQKMRTVDVLETAAWRTRAIETRPGETTRVMNECVKALWACRTAAETRAFRRTIAERFRAVAVEPERPVLRVGLVGEVSVLRDRTLNQNIAETLGRLGVEVYNFFLLGSELGNIFGINFRNPNSHGALGKVAEPYLKCRVGGHALGSIAHTMRCAKRGYDGMVHLAPSGCMPEVSIRPILRKVAADLDIPVLTLSFDEHTSPVGVATRVEAFVDILHERARNGRRRAS